jgi:hypothetical protein
LLLNGDPSIPSKLLFVEFKSYKEVMNIPLNQFKNYLSSVTDLRQMKYVFNASKFAAGTNAKDGMKRFLKANAETLFKEVNDGGIGEVKFKQLFGIDDIDVFKARLENADYFNQYTSFVDSN